jgi:hypothetical protein
LAELDAGKLFARAEAQRHKAAKVRNLEELGLIELFEYWTGLNVSYSESSIHQYGFIGSK